MKEDWFLKSTWNNYGTLNKTGFAYLFLFVMFLANMIKDSKLSASDTTDIIDSLLFSQNFNLGIMRQYLKLIL